MTTDTETAARLRSFIERIERMDEDIQALKDDRKEILAEAKATGFDSKIINRIVALRKKDPDSRAEEEAILAAYLDALGMS